MTIKIFLLFMTRTIDYLRGAGAGISTVIYLIFYVVEDNVLHTLDFLD